MTAVDLKYPLGGLSENLSFTDQPPRTTQDETNMRCIDPKTGRLRGAQRAGSSKYLSAQNPAGSHAVKDLNFVVVNDKQNTYAELADGSISTEWIARTGGGNDVNDIAVDVFGNIYCLDGDAAGFSVVNPDGETITNRSVPVITGALRRIAVDGNQNVYLGLSRDGTQADARLWKFSLNEDGEYEEAWEASIKTVASATTGVVSYITGIKIIGVTMYILLWDDTTNQAECHVYEGTANEPLTPSVSFTTLNDAGSGSNIDVPRGLDVNDGGEILIASTDTLVHDLTLYDQWLVKYSPIGATVWTVQSDDTNTEGNGDDAEGIGSACAFDSNGDVFAFGSLVTGASTAGGLMHFFDNGSTATIDWRVSIPNQDLTTNSREFTRIAVDSENNVYVPGPTLGSGNIDNFVKVYDRHGAAVAAYADPGGTDTGSLCVALTPSRPDYGDDSVTIDEFVYIGRTKTTTTLTVTGATNATPIVLSTGGGAWRTGEWCRNVGILGTTAANGTWKVTNVTSASWSLDGSVGNAAFSAGGTQISNVLGALEKVRLVSVTSSTGSQRSMVRAGVANGAIYRFDTSSWTTPNGSAALDVLSEYVQSVAHFGKLYYVDGKNTVVFDPADHTTSANGEVSTLVSKSSGSVPPLCKLVVSWRGRLVLARDADDGHNWFMSARDDPTNWDYFPPVITSTIAVAGNSSDVGRAPDIINTLIPWSDDLLIFGCDHSIWRLTGDPMDGGQIDQVPTDYGMAFGRPWTEGPRGEIYFFGSRGGVHVMTPSGNRQRLSVNTIERRLTDIDLSKYNVRLVWNYRDEGLHVFFTERGALTGTPSTGQATHYFWEAKTNSWHPDTFKVVTDVDVADLEPASVMVIDGDTVADRRMLIGRDDGYVSKWDDTVSNDDDGTSPDVAIASSVLMGPYSIPGTPATSRWSRFQFTLADNQNGCNFELFSSDSPDVKGSPKAQGSLAAGSNSLRFERILGQYIWVKLQNAAVSSHWSFERAICEAVPAGRVRILG